MKITYDPAKRAKNIADHGIDFEDAPLVFEHPTFDVQKVVKGETRTVSIGWLIGRMVMVVWTARDDSHRIISMRKCNSDEQEKYAPRF